MLAKNKNKSSKIEISAKNKNLQKWIFWPKHFFVLPKL